MRVAIDKVVVRFAAAMMLLGGAPLAVQARSTRAASPSALVVDTQTGATLFAEAPDTVRAPASLTKMMTLYLAFDAMAAGRLKLTTPIPISRHAAAQQPSRLGIAAGRSLPARTALSVVAVDSANDVAVALAEYLGGSEPRFVQQMNRAAKRLGLRHTHFGNATGLTNRGNRTTARDMATLAQALLWRFPRDYSYFGTRRVTWQKRSMVNHNHLLGKVPGVDGIKTGYTADAGYNLAASARRGGRRIVVVVLGARTAASRDARVANLIQLGFTPAAPKHAQTTKRRHR